ncbi:hypothetical protein LY28_01201 [Ruminiclostridium sufflavum DSM 19573]|uniref:Uncharacterized protein n=1 Tax=Ruminiclostridium sufflavum DSM 19573 TaxID=1121337 RepID=A0A318XPG9_9FIRM|nr:hypothetical protein [Ruminiclostridium sufflavum]PYG88840.1 hypothetical protein LY28_01201 [Ruminiclostridium sufflavum DSM 19573]
MLLRQGTAEVNNKILLESIKSDIQLQLKELGVTTSGINVEMNSKNISLNIGIRCLSRRLRQLQFNAN